MNLIPTHVNVAEVPATQQATPDAPFHSRLQIQDCRSADPRCPTGAVVAANRSSEPLDPLTPGPLSSGNLQSPVLNPE